MLNLFKKDGTVEDILYIIEGVSSIKYLGRDVYDVLIVSSHESMRMPYYKEEIIKELPMWKRMGGVIISSGWSF